MKLKKVHEEINRLELYKKDESITEHGEQLLEELKYLTKLANNTEIIGSVSEIDKELIEWINDTEKRVDMFNKKGCKNFAEVSDNFIEAYKSVRDMINEKCSR